MTEQVYAPVNSATPALTKPEFVKLESLDPNSSGVNLVVKVAQVQPKLNRPNFDGTRMIINEAIVGDSTGCIVFTVRGEEQIHLVNVGETLIIRNAKVEMFRGYMRLAVDRWGVLDQADGGALNEEVNVENNLSAIEYELVAAPAR